jgi:hypothetical protein
MLFNDLLQPILGGDAYCKHSDSDMTDVINVLRDQDFSIDILNNARNSLINSFGKYETVFEFPIKKGK